MSVTDVLWIDYDDDVFTVSVFPDDILYDTAGSATVVDKIIEEYGEVERVDWTDAALEAAGRSPSTTSKAVEAAVEQLSELNIKVVNLANKLDEHLKEIDAHHQVAVSGRVKKK